GLDLDRKAPGKALCRSFTDHGQCVSHPAQWLEAKQNGGRIDADHADAEQRKVGEQPALELADLLFQLRAVTHHAETRGPVLRIKNELAFEHFQFLTRKALGRVAALEGRVEGNLSNRGGRER